MKLTEKYDLDKVFFISDTHFYHENILKFCHRPFKDINDQTEQLISNWNSVVPEDGIVFQHGDFIHNGQIDVVRRIVERLNGKIWWILGNHCYQSRHDRKVIADIVEGRQADVITWHTRDEHDTRIFMSHYPHLYWPRGCYHTHGHIHSGPNSTASEVAPLHPLRYDVGVDNNLYTPVSYHKLMEIFNVQKLKSIEYEINK